MRAKVTARGLRIPPHLLQGIDEVEIEGDRGLLLVKPIMATDPITGLGSSPVDCGTTDAAENHDKYLYSSEE